MITGLVANSFQNLQLDAGVFLKEFDYSQYNSTSALKNAISAAIGTDKCLGATRGGGTFTATPTTHSIEADGKRYEFVGSTRYDSWEIKLSTTLLEVTADTFSLALGSVKKTGSGVTKLEINTQPKAADYINNLCWVGELSDGGMVLISLANAMNTSGANFTFSDKGEGTLPVEFTAYQSNVDDYDTAPAAVVFFPKAS